MTNPASRGDDRAGYGDTTRERGAVETGYVRYAERLRVEHRLPSINRPALRSGIFPCVEQIENFARKTEWMRIQSDGVVDAYEEHFFSHRLRTPRRSLSAKTARPVVLRLPR